MRNKQLLVRTQFSVSASLNAKSVKKYKREGRAKPAGYVAGNRPGYNPDEVDKITKQAEVYHL